MAHLFTGSLHQRSNPRFFAEGLKLVAPTRSQTEVQGNAVVQIDNPQRRWLTATYSAKGSHHWERCTEQAVQNGQISCLLPQSGSYEVSLFSGSEQYGQHAYVGQVEFNKQ
ncbi:MAG TPA: hypothetical protein V6C65_21125 [Allocoleopsis sp.]